MNKKRKIYLLLTLSITLLSSYQFLETYSKFQFLIDGILDHLHKRVIIYMIFVFLIAVTGCLAIIYNWQLLKGPRTSLQTTVIDRRVSKKTPSTALHMAYIVFSILVIGLGCFLIFTAFKEAADQNSAVIIWILSIVIIGLGALLLKDGATLKKGKK